MTPWDWAEFAAAYAVFLLSHALPAQTGGAAQAGSRARRARLPDRLRRRLARGARVADLGVRIARPTSRSGTLQSWQLWLANLVMPLACLLIAFAVGAPNPLSFGGRAEGFDPRRPGVAGLARHPLLVALALWACVHAIANGDRGSLAAVRRLRRLRGVGRADLDRRRQRRSATRSGGVSRPAPRTGRLPRSSTGAGAPGQLSRTRRGSSSASCSGSACSRCTRWSSASRRCPRIEPTRVG